MPENFEPTYIPKSVPIPPVEFESDSKGLTDKQINETAFYGAALSGSENPIETFDTIIDEYQSNGYSSLVNNIRQSYKNSKDFLNSTVMENIIADETLSKEQKIKALKHFQYSGDQEVDLKLQYLQNLAASREEDFTDMDYTKTSITINDLQKDTIAYELASDFSKVILNEPMPQISEPELDQRHKKAMEVQDNLPWYSVFDNKVMKPVTAEMLSAVKNFVVGAIPYLTELGGTLALAPTDKYSMTTARAKAKEFVNSHGGEAVMSLFDDMAEDWFGITPEMLDDTVVTKLLTNLDEGMMALSQKINKDNPEAVKVPMEIVLAVLLARNKKLPGDLKAIGRKGKLEYYKRTDPNYYEVLKNQPVKEKVGKYNVERILPTEKRESVQIIKQSRADLPDNHPLNVTRRGNPKAAETLLEAVIEDPTGKALKSLNLTPGQFIYYSLMPKFFQNKLHAEPLNGSATMKKLIQEQKLALEEYAVNKFFVDMPQRKAYIEGLTESVNEISDGVQITANPSEFSGRFSGRQIETNLVFNKTATSNYKSFGEAIDAVQKLEKKVTELNEGKTTDIGEFFIENLGQKGDVVGVYKLKDLRDLAISPEANNISPNFRVKWHKTQDFIDGMEAIANGLGRMDWKNQNFLYRTLFSPVRLYNWFAAFGKRTRETDMTLTLASMRSEGFMRKQVELLDGFINKQDNVFRGQLDTLYKVQQGKSDLLSTNEIYDALGTSLAKSRVDALQEALGLTRQVERFNYLTLNNFELNRYNAAGYKHYLDLTDSEGTLSRIMVKEDFDFSIIPAMRPSKLWDMQTNEAVDFGAINISKEAIPGKQMLMNNNQPTRQIVRLSKPFYDKDGTGYNYAIMDKANKLTGNPDWIIPTLTGHLPRISEASFFVRAYPYRVTMDGNTSVADFNTVLKDHAPHGRAIQHFRTETEAKKFINENIKDGNSFAEYDSKQFRFEIEKARELESKDNVEANFLREASLNAARSRTSLPFNPDLYAEPYTSLVRTSISNGSRIYQQGLLEEFKAAFVKAYKNKVDLGDNRKGKIGDYDVDITSLRDQADTITEFPLNREQIKQLGGDSDIFNQALSDYDAIVHYDAGLPSNHFAKLIGYMSDFVGKLADVDNPVAQMISRSARKAERNANTIAQAPLRVLSTLNIIMSPFWRQIPLQSMNIYGPMLVADPKLFRSTLHNTGMTLYMRIQNLPYFKKYEAYSKEVAKYYLEQERVINKVGADKAHVLSMKDHLLILEELDRSGLGRVSEHVLAKGIFSSIPNNLVSESAFSKYGSKVTRAFSKAGLEAGEYAHRVGMWHAVRVNWMNNNPGKNWRSRQALNEITYGAHQLAGSMTKQNTLAFQNISMLQYLGQFMSYSAKVAETAWNPAASPFTGKQRAYLAAYNLAMFGTRYGLPLGIGLAVLEALKAGGANDLADALDQKGLLTYTILGMSDFINPTYDEEGNLIKSQADISKVFSPFGGEIGGPYFQFYKAYAIMTGLSDGSDYNAGPVLESLHTMNDTMNMFHSMYTTKGFTFDEKMLRSVELLARFTAVGRSFYNYTMYNELNEKVAKSGQSTGSKYSKADQFMTLFSIPNRQDQNSFETFAEKNAIDAQIEQLASDFYQNMVGIKGKNFAFSELMEIFQANNAILHDKIGDYGIEKFWDEIGKLDNRRYKSRDESLLLQIHEMAYAGDRKYTAEQIQVMKKGAEALINAQPGLKDDVDALIQILEKQTKGN